MRVLLLTLTLFAANAAMGQSLSFEDLINLQRNDLDKAKGYFNYKGWRWTGTKKDCGNCLNSSGYDLTYDMTSWTNNSENIQLLQSVGHPNAVIYYTGPNGFNALERETKGILEADGSGTLEDRMWTMYSGNGLSFTYNTQKTRGQISYNIAIVNKKDVDSRTTRLCKTCKGKGQITEKEKCSSCSGDGRKNCKCRHNGRGPNSCNKCIGTGNTDIVCSSCNGSGNSKREIKKICATCNGSKLKKQ